MGDNRILLWQHCCHANQSFASKEEGSGKKLTTSDMRIEGQKKEISSDTLLMGPIDYVSGIDLLVSILTKWIINFSRRQSFWTKTSS